VIGSGGSLLHPSAARFGVPARGRPADKGAQIAAVAPISPPFLTQQGIQGRWRSTYVRKRKEKMARKPGQCRNRMAGARVKARRCRVENAGAFGAQGACAAPPAPVPGRADLFGMS
jgi:hypothetical protein